MYSVWKNGKCLRLFKTLKGAFRYYCGITEKSDELKDSVELHNPDGCALFWF